MKNYMQKCTSERDAHKNLNEEERDSNRWQWYLPIVLCWATWPSLASPRLALLWWSEYYKNFSPMATWVPEKFEIRVPVMSIRKSPTAIYHLINQFGIHDATVFTMAMTDGPWYQLIKLVSDNFETEKNYPNSECFLLFFLSVNNNW